MTSFMEFMFCIICASEQLWKWMSTGSISNSRLSINNTTSPEASRLKQHQREDIKDYSQLLNGGKSWCSCEQGKV